jgi:hypothetical protein
MVWWDFADSGSMGVMCAAFADNEAIPFTPSRFALRGYVQEAGV